jgi:protein-tyrosine phosphatase
MKKILFICTGNICRSPTAEGVMRHLAEKMNIPVQVESAGTHDYHVGDAPDRRAQQHARNRGYEIGEQRARQLRKRDFEQFDLLVAMDRGHLEIMQAHCPPQHQGKLRMLVDGHDVPDPYYGGVEGFEQVLDMVEAACLGLISELRSSMRAPPDTTS